MSPANGFDEVGWQGFGQRKSPAKVIATPQAIAALDRQLHSLAVLESTPLYQQLCAEADAKRLEENSAPRHGSGKLVK